MIQTSWDRLIGTWARTFPTCQLGRHIARLIKNPPDIFIVVFINSDYNGFELKSALNAICQFAENALIMSSHVKAIVTRFLLNALMMSSQMNTI